MRQPRRRAVGAAANPMVTPSARPTAPAFSGNSTLASSSELSTAREASRRARQADPPLSPADIRHNVLMLVMIDCIWIFGASEMMLAAGPLYKYLKASNLMVSLMGASQALGIPGVLLAPYLSRRFPYKKVYLFCVHLPYIGPWGLLGLGLILSKALSFSTQGLVYYVLAMNCLSGVFAGFVTLPHQEYVAACVPMSHRGRLSGYSNATGSAIAIVSNVLAGWILLSLAKPMAFGWMYLMTWLICQSGYLFALFGRERRTPVEDAPAPWSRPMVLAVLRDRPYLKVIALNCVYVIFFFPVLWTFLAYYGLRDLKMIAATAAVIGVIQKVATLLTAAQMGRLVDRYSPSRVLVFVPLAMVATLLPVILWRSPYAVYASCAIGVLVTVGTQSTFNALFFGMPKPEDRSGHFTFQILASYASIGCQVIEGLIFDKLGYRPTFVLLAVLALLLVPVSKHVLAPLSERPDDYS
jgi:hypothetical protein